ncbi:glycoside hydrolase family 88 protein [Leifsonia bigeumensis]|uniref:Glycoside hydrolase family 88 protein n=1 Tax=Leifsonella bigeumensis TaxID=433643 RepID=A0ABP7FFS7_9MICO
MDTLEAAWNEIALEADILRRMPAFPIWTDGDSWITAEFDQDERGVLPHHGSWMVGDLPAILWFLASGEDDPEKRTERHDLALTWSTRLANRTATRSFASVSHMFFRGTLVGMAIAGEKNLEPLALAAAKTISDRFLEIGYMKSFGPPEDHEYPFTTVDDVINLTVPLWYAREKGDEELAAAAIAAIHVIADGLIRPDGSTGQVLLFDKDRKPTRVDTYQGYSPDGCWSRGQAWGIYGFATVYRQTGEARFLDIAQSMADYWMDRVQDDPSPIWDFDLPESEPKVRDSFAAGLAYAGLLELAEASDGVRRAELRSYAKHMVEALAIKHVIGKPRGHGIVAGAALDVPHNHGIDSSVIVGDSYFTEAVWRLTASERRSITPRMVPA